MWDDQGRAELVRRLEAEEAAYESSLAEQERINEVVAKRRARVELLRELVGSRARSQRGRQSRSASAVGGLQAGSRIERAYQYLCHEGDSRHVKDILVALGEPDDPEKRNALSTQVNRYVRKGRVFAADETKGPRFFRALVADGEPGEASE